MRAAILVALAAALAAAACDDDFGPLDWDAVPDTVTLYSLARSDLLGLPSAFDFIALQPIRVEAPGATGSWDVAVSEESGAFVLLPAGALPGVSPGAGIAVIEDRSFDAVERAPTDTAAFRRAEAVPIRSGVVYVIRTRLRSGTTCVHYAKLEPLAVDAAAGSFQFRVIRNPLCSDRALVPRDRD